MSEVPGNGQAPEDRQRTQRIEQRKREPQHGRKDDTDYHKAEEPARAGDIEKRQGRAS
jgi:hypothetical protein